MPDIKTIKFFRWLWLAFMINDYGDVACRSWGFTEDSAIYKCGSKEFH